MSAVPTASQAASPRTPKNNLEGLTLKSGWTLVEQLMPSSGSSGSNFGAGYKATRGDEIAFVKAIDFVSAITDDDPIEALGRLSAEATFEKDVLAYCAEKGMTKVMRYYGHEYISADGTNNPMTNVSCLIMEAGQQDLRRLVNGTGLAACAWNLQVMRDVSMAVAQLHGGGIAHQDIKPSNVISVAEKTVQQPQTMKVGDLGRVVRRDRNGPFDASHWPGDVRYSPPERWYGFLPANWNDAREASDAYMLGSLLVYLFTGATLQSLVYPLIPEPFKPGKWTGSFDQNLLPVLVDIHARILNDHLKPVLMPDIQDSIMAIAKDLTQPDPLLRGDSKARRQIGRPVGIDRIHQKLRYLALTCAAIERGRRGT